MKKKPVVIIEFFPSPKTYGWLGFILMAIAYIIVSLIYFIIQDWFFLLTVTFMFILGGWIGREFERHRDPIREQKLADDMRNKYNEKKNKRIKTEETNKIYKYLQFKSIFNTKLTRRGAMIIPNGTPRKHLKNPSVILSLQQKFIKVIRVTINKPPLIP